MTQFHDRRLKPIEIATEALRRNMQRYRASPIEDVRLEGLRPLHHLDDPMEIENPGATHIATFSYRMPDLADKWPRIGHAFSLNATEGHPREIYHAPWDPSFPDWQHFTGRRITDEGGEERMNLRG